MLKPYQQREHLAIKKAQGNPLLGTLGQLAGTAIGTAVGGPAGATVGSALGSQLGNVASGAPINPTEMAVSGLTAGISAGSNAAKTATADMLDAKDAVTTAFQQSGVDSKAYNTALEKLKSAGSKAMEAESSLLNDPFGKAGNAVKSVFMAEGGEVNPNKKRKNHLAMVSPLAAAMSLDNPLKAVSPLAAIALAEGGEVKPQSKLKRDKDGKLILPLNIDFSKLEREPEYHRQEEANLRQQLESKKKDVKLAMGGKAKGPLCSSCEAEYKACGGMTKKKY